MSAAPPSSFGRRAFLAGAAAGTGLLLARGLGARSPLAAGGAEASQAELLRALGGSLTAKQRELIVFPFDHPTRQIVNTISIIERPHLGTLLSPAQRVLVERLYESMLSPRGRQDFAGTVAVEGRLDGCVLALYGEPESGRAQAVIMGGHLMLRGGESPAGAAFGGGIAYGHQIGNQTWRVAGNSFAYHGDAANRLYSRLDAAERARAIAAAPPHELVLQPQTAAGSFDGARVGSLSAAAREEAARLLDTVFSPYPEEARRDALACIEANGGVDALHVAYYAEKGFWQDMTAWSDVPEAERIRRGDPYWQVWRIEGPGTVVHFQGHPHVHAYIQVVRDPSRANVGESLARTEVVLAGEPLRALLEAAMRRASGEALAFYPERVPARICPGEITAGVAYALDPYRNRVVVATVEGRALAEEARRRLDDAGVAVDEGQRYRIATTDYTAGERESFGEPLRVETSSVLLRDAVVAHLRAGAV